MFWSYSAGLVSSLTVEKYDFPIKSLQVSLMELIKLGSSWSQQEGVLE